MKNKKYILWVDRYTLDKGYDKKTMVKCEDSWIFRVLVETYGVENISYISFGVMFDEFEISLSSLRWLKMYCKYYNKPMPKCISHSKNKVFNEKFNKILIGL